MANDLASVGSFPVSYVAYLGALLPGLGCYACISYAYIFQSERTLNFTTSDCPEVRSSLPPVSYSIGVWEPQRFFWLMILFAHLPPRIFFGQLSGYYYGLACLKCNWYRNVLYCFRYMMLIEATGLISVSVIDIHSHFFIHAICYTIWVVAFNFNMLFNLIMHHFSGYRSHSSTSNRLWHVKRVMFITGVTLAISTGFTYPYYMTNCVGWAYVAFSIAEYSLVGYNCFFHFLSLWEFPNVRVGLAVDFSLARLPK